MLRSSFQQILKPTRFFSIIVVGSFFNLFLPVNLIAEVSPSQADYYIAVTGEDSYSGTKQNPFATFQRAFKAVEKEVAKGLKKNIVVEIQTGVYEIENGLEIGPEVSGNKKYSITYKVARGSRVIISGGETITGWKKEPDGLWSAPLETKAGSKEGVVRETLEFYVSGQRRSRSRFPNKGYLKVEKSGPDNRTSFTFNENDIDEFPLGPQAEILFLHDWSTSRIGIQSIDFQKREMVFKNPIGCSARHYRINHFEKHPRYRLENDIAFLDESGEWFHDVEKGRIYYKPVANESFENFEGVVPVAKSLLVIKGADEKKVQNVQFKGIQFSYCAWSIPEGGYAAGQAGFHEKRDGSKSGVLREIIPSAITINNAENCVLDSCVVSHLGGSGIWLESQCDNCSIRNSVIADVAGNGILVGEDHNRKIKGKVWWHLHPEQVSKHNIVHSNLIKKCGVLYRGCLGIWVGIAQKTEITQNTLSYLPYTGISLGWIWNPKPSPCQGNIVSKNHIHHVMQELSDGGGIYTLGRQPGTKLIQNWIHDIPLNLGRAESNGMFLDEGTTGILIKENVIYNIDKSPLRFHRAGENRVEQNFLAVKENIPTVRYNTTPEINIHLEKNFSLPHQSWLLKDFTSFPEKFRPIIKSAGRKIVEDPRIHRYKLNRIPE
jgi:Right handed beta helix region/GH141 insertion domain